MKKTMITEKIDAQSVKPTAKNRPVSIIRTIFRRYGIVVLLIVLLIFFSILMPNTFATATNFRTILITQAVLLCMALAASLPLIVGEFDLSIGYMLGFSAVVGARLADVLQLGALATAGVMLLVGLLVGLLNGLLTVKFGIASLIVTLGVGIALSGLSAGVSGGQTLFQGIPQGIIALGRGKLLGIAFPVWIALAVVIVLHVVLARSTWGRRLYAVGGSERVARLAGVATQRVRILAFVLAGGLVGLGAIFQLAAAGAANPGFGSNLMLPAYAAVFLGSTAFRPGFYNVFGTVTAILLIAIGVNGVTLLGAPIWVEPVFYGSVLILAVIASRAEAKRMRASW